MHQGNDFWKNYMERWFGSELIGEWSQHCTLTSIESSGGPIGLEVYDTGSPERPTLVFSHGIAGYARVLLPFLIPLRHRGYNLVAPDLRGYGYNEDRKGDFDWNTHVDNLGDAVRFARERFDGPVLLGGASMGGPLAYAAAARHGGVDGLVCWCLWDFQDREFMTHETMTGRLTYLLVPFMALFSKLLGHLRLKTTYFVSYDTLTDNPQFNDLLKQDPQAGTLISLRGAQSLVLQSAVDVPHAAWTAPTLVLQPGADRMTPKRYTKRVFDQLASENKLYVELEGCEHFPTEAHFYERWAQEVDDFVSSLEPRTTP
jgi:alpha-beta hydrolase superfamily lysophospholipase